MDVGTSDVKGVRVFFLKHTSLWMLVLQKFSICLLLLVAIFLVSTLLVLYAVTATVFICMLLWIFFREYIYHARSLTYNHWSYHNKHWKKRLKELYKEKQKYVEAGTVVDMLERDCVKYIEVLWDCGYRECYPQSSGGKWESIRVYDLGPAGYRSPFIVCDECMLEITGFGFQCLDKKCSVDLSQIYDLCHKHYNENCHSGGDHRFHPILSFGPKEDEIYIELPLRKSSTQYSMLGLFPESKVIEYYDEEDEREGTILWVRHEEGRPFELAKCWNCCVELVLNGQSSIIKAAGSRGSVQVKVTQPLNQSVPIYADHFPSFDNTLIEELKSRKLSANDDYVLMNFHFRDAIYRSLIGTNRHLTSIDSEDPVWEKCCELNLVHLFRNNLRVLPRRLMEHPLSMLSLSYNDFYDFPRVILSIATIQNLNMVNNHLTFLPSGLSRLTSLTNLHLGSNNIIYLPDCFEGLANLVVLTLQDNQLTSLPPSFDTLSKLEVLYLNNNSFCVFPNELLKLSKLRVLKLHCNRIQSFSQEAIEFCEEIENCTKYSNNNTHALRVLVVGESDGGKTSLIQALCTKQHVIPNLSKRDNHTVGIDNYHYHFRNNELSLWDFAGERSYAMMNALFLTNADIVWVVFNISKFECTRECYESTIGIWLRMIISHFEEETLPSIKVMGTHKDKCRDQDLRNKSSFIHVNLSSIKSMSDRPLKDVIYFLSNTFTLDGHDKLVNDIDNLSFQNKADQQWFSEEHRLNLKAAEMIREHQLPLMTMESFEKFVNVSNKSEFIKYLHGNGEIFVLRFSDRGGEKTAKVFLNAKWFIYILKQIFRHDLKEYVISQLLVDRCDPEKKDDVLNHLKEGEVSKGTLELLWKALNVENCRDVAQILCDYNLFYIDHPDNDYYVIPWLLNDSMATSATQENAKAPHISLKFTYEYIDFHFFEKILFTFKHNKNYVRNVWNMMEFNTNYYKLYVICENNLERLENVFDCISFHIFATVEIEYPALWQIVKNDIIDRINELLKVDKQYARKLFPTYVVCPQCNLPDESQSGWFLWTDLINEYSKQKYCTVCKREISIVEIFPREDLNNLTLENVVTAIESVFEWQRLGIQLQISKTTLDNIEKRCCHETHRFKSEMIQSWLNSDICASWSKLCKALIAMGEERLAYDIKNSGLVSPIHSLINN